MKKKTSKVKQDFEIDTRKPTPRLDAIKNGVNKLLSATAATYIPESCDALRQDWFPSMTDEIMKKNPAVQEAIREKILDTYATERVYDGVWKESSIKVFLSPWLRYVEVQESHKSNQQKATEAAQQKAWNKFSKQVTEQKNRLNHIVEQLPEAPKEEAEEQSEESETTGKATVYEPKPKELPTPLESYELGVRAIEKLWESLTNVDHTPGAKEDVFNEYIKPSDKFRLRLWKGLDEGRAIHYHDLLVWTETVVKRTLDLWDEIQGEKADKK